MTYDVDLNEMKAYILNKFKNEGDFDFLKEGLMEELVDEMMSVDQAYLAKLSEDDDYEDDFEEEKPKKKRGRRRIRDAHRRPSK